MCGSLPCGRLCASHCCIHARLELLTDVVRTGLMACGYTKEQVKGADGEQFTAGGPSDGAVRAQPENGSGPPPGSLGMHRT